jgi:hypothetical protein
MTVLTVIIGVFLAVWLAGLAVLTWLDVWPRLVALRKAREVRKTDDRLMHSPDG